MSSTEKSVSVQVNAETLKILNDIAKQADISRHKLIHDMLELTIDEMDFGRRIGFFQMIVLIRKFSDKVMKPTKAAADEPAAEEKNIPIRLSPEYLARLDVLANAADRTRHYLMKKFIEVGASELDKIHNKKIPVTHGLMMRKLKLKMRSLCDEGEKAFTLYSAEIDPK